MKKRLIAISLLVTLALAAAAVAAARPRLRISGWKLPFNLHVAVEIKKEVYKETFADYDSSIVTLQTGPRLMSALAAGELDVVQGIGDAAFLVAIAGGIEAKIVAVNSRSPKAFALVARKGIDDVAALAGKRVAGLRGSVVHQVFIDALAEAGLTEADVEFFPMPVAQAASTLIAGQVDAALLVGGDVLRAQKAGCKVLADGEGRVEGLSLAVASDKFLKANPEFPERFLRMREKTLGWLKESRGEAAEIAVEELSVDRDDVETMLLWYDFDPTFTEKDSRSLGSTADYLLKNGMIREMPKLAGLVYNFR